MGDYNMDNTSLTNTCEALAYSFDTSHTNIAWAIRNGPEYPKDLNVAGTFQHLSIYTTFLTSVKSGLQTVYNKGQTAKSQLEEV